MGKIKRILLLALLLLAGSFGYYQWNEARLLTMSSPILFVPKTTDQSISFWRAMHEGVNAAAKEYGVKVQVAGTLEETDVKGQIRLLEEAITQKPRAIILAATDYNLLVPVSDQIRKAGIPLITVDSGVYGTMNTSFVSTDNYSAGRKAGKAMLERLPRGAKVAVINFVKGSATAIERERGVGDSLSEGGIEIVETLYSNALEERAYALTKDLLLGEKGSQIQGIVCLNEPSTVGAARALKEWQRPDSQIVMVGFDSSMKEIAFLEEGVLQAIVVQKPFNMGYLAIKTAWEAANGKSVPSRIDTGAEVITPSNMFTKENQKLLFPFAETSR
jgi:ribose transport system substrate-binding protein